MVGGAGYKGRRQFSPNTGCRNFREGSHRGPSEVGLDGGVSQVVGQVGYLLIQSLVVLKQ